MDPQQQQQRIERLESFVALLQQALGWVIDMEAQRPQRDDYDVQLVIQLRFGGKVWPEILRDRPQQEVVKLMVERKLERIFEDELRKSTGT